MLLYPIMCKFLWNSTDSSLYADLWSSLAWSSDYYDDLPSGPVVGQKKNVDEFRKTMHDTLRVYMPWISSPEDICIDSAHEHAACPVDIYLPARTSAAAPPAPSGASGGRPLPTASSTAAAASKEQAGKVMFDNDLLPSDVAAQVRSALQPEGGGASLVAAQTPDVFWSLVFLQRIPAWHVLRALPYDADLLREEDIARRMSGCDDGGVADSDGDDDDDDGRDCTREAGGVGTGGGGGGGRRRRDDGDVWICADMLRYLARDAGREEIMGVAAMRKLHETAKTKYGRDVRACIRDMMCLYKYAAYKCLVVPQGMPTYECESLQRRLALFKGAVGGSIPHTTTRGGASEAAIDGETGENGVSAGGGVRAGGRSAFATAFASALGMSSQLLAALSPPRSSSLYEDLKTVDAQILGNDNWEVRVRQLLQQEFPRGEIVFRPPPSVVISHSGGNGSRFSLEPNASAVPSSAHDTIWTPPEGFNRGVEHQALADAPPPPVVGVDHSYSRVVSAANRKCRTPAKYLLRSPFIFYRVPVLGSVYFSETLPRNELPLTPAEGIRVLKYALSHGY